MESTAQLSADADENMRLAVERFRTKMEASNRQFLQDRIDEIEAMGLSTEAEKLDKMRKYWSGLTVKHDENAWMVTAPPEIARQLREEGNVTRLVDVKTLYHQYMNGAGAPNVWSDEWRQMFLDTVQSVCNEVAIRDEDDHDFEVPPCHDLALFLKYANSVNDPDFRYAGMAPFEPPGRTSKETSDIAKDRENLIHDLHRYYLLEEDYLVSFTYSGLDVRVGFQTGIGVKYKLGGHDEWYSTYLYCRRHVCEMHVEDSDQSHKDWAWRVVVSPAGIPDPEIVYGRRPRFNSIVEFLDWYSSWLDYLDMDQVREDVALNWGEEEEEEM